MTVPVSDGAFPSDATASADMLPDEFRRHAHETVDWMADFLSAVEVHRVSPEVRPGEIRAAIAENPPSHGEAMNEILADFRDIVLPGINHWNHPSFFGYFNSSASGPGILGEMIAATLNVNAMVWKSAPAATELEDVATDWLRQLLGLPGGFEGVINDTASSSSLYALAAAREVAYPGAHDRGLFGLPPGRVYASEHAHSSIEKAVLTLGFGREGFRAIPADDRFRMDPRALTKAIEEDRDAGYRPVAIVATLGTTSSASVDPMADLARIAAENGVWLHVDAAYGGAAAIVPEAAPLFSGWEASDSIVMNPHKWLFTPIDCSVLFCRRPAELVRAFSIVPEYLTSADQGATRSLMDYGVSLGRRFRSLKLWFVLRYFGRDGLEALLRGHMQLARDLAKSIEAEPNWTVVAPVELGTVVFRHETGQAEIEDEVNHRILAAVNASGDAFLTHTVLNGRVVIRLAIGHLKTTRDHVDRVWLRLREAAAAVDRP